MKFNADRESEDRVDGQNSQIEWSGSDHLTSSRYTLLDSIASPAEQLNVDTFLVVTAIQMQPWSEMEVVCHNLWELHCDARYEFRDRRTDRRTEGQTDEA
ncbi:hypothetical protein GCK32_008766, partial [Trichostrongylus colubriformis]